MVILFKQKSAWAKYAKDKGLVYTKGTFSGPCMMEGTINDFSVSFFTAMQQKEDSRKNRQLTVVQLILSKSFIDMLAAGTQEMLPFLNSLDALTPHAIENEKWDSKHNHLFSKNKKAVENYLTDERIIILNNILKISNSDNFVILSDDQGLFRFETSNPLTDADKIDKLVTKLMINITKLRPDKDEAMKLKELKTLENKINVSDNEDITISLELEDD